MAAEQGTVTLLAGGDIGPTVDPVDELAEHLVPVMDQADLRFAQCERVYSERGLPPHWNQGPTGQHARLPARMASIWETTKIDVVSLASNHAMDWGPEPMLDTVELLRGMGKHVIGAGIDSEAARRPAIVERNGVRIAFLAYCSGLRDGQAAGVGRPGVAPMRAHTFYETETYHPGSPPRIITQPYEEDLANLQQDIRSARDDADAVVLSLHWGLTEVPKTLAMYQTVVAHAAIDAGADLILGHHSHPLKAVEVYKGKVCFYSIGFLVTTWPAPPLPFKWNLIWYRPDPECLPLFPGPSDSRKNILVKAVLNRNGIRRVSFLPTFINAKAQPQVLSSTDPKFQETLDYLEWVSDQHPHKFTVEGDEVVVDTSL